jgi:hypothetical protein
VRPGGVGRGWSVTLPIIVITLLIAAACNAGDGGSGSGPAGAGESVAASQPSPSPTPPLALVSVDPGCSVQQQPGPGDAPPAGGGETDTTGQGPGRWRICLTVPAPISVEGSAWCTWNGDRSAVDEISGLPSTAGSIDYDAFLPFATQNLEVHLTDRANGGTIANFAPRQPTAIASDPKHTTGTAAFDVALEVDPESAPPAGAPPTVAGTIAWVCGAPPPA